jgi:hypothetical protein
MDPEVQAALDRVTCELRNEVYLSHRIKSDVSDLCFMATGLFAMSIINILLHYACSELLSEIKQSMPPSKAVQTEVSHGS